ncbi:hypothetical protein [Amycolatopsis echigonensis]
MALLAGAAAGMLTMLGPRAWLGPVDWAGLGQWVGGLGAFRRWLRTPTRP